MSEPLVDRVRRALGAEASAPVRIARNVVSILAGDAAGEAINTIVTGRQAVALGPEKFGALSAAQAFVDPFRAIAAFGLSVVAVTVASKRGGPDGTLVRTLVALFTVFSLLSSTLAVSISQLTGYGGSLSLVLSASFAVLPVVAMNAAKLPAQYEQAMHKLVALPLVIALSRWALVEGAIHTSNTALAHQWALTIAAVIGVLATAWVVSKLYNLEGAASRSVARELLQLAWPIAVLDVTVTIYLKAAYLLLRDRGDAVLGAYAAAERLAQPIVGVSAAIVASALPIVSKAAQDGDASALSAVYRSTIRRAVVALLPVLSLSAAVAPWAIARFAPQYAHASRPFQVLLIGGLFMFLNQLSSMFIVGIGRVRALMVIALFNLAVYFALATKLVPLYGATGSAIATTVMEGVNCAMQLIVVRALLKARR